MENMNLIEIKESKIKENYTKSLRLLQTCKYNVSKNPNSGDREVNGVTVGNYSNYTAGTSVDNSYGVTFNVYENLLNIRKEDDLASEIEMHIFRTLRRGISIFYTMYDQYEEASGLDNLVKDNIHNKLLESQKVELSEKVKTSTLVSQFVMASYILTELSGYKNEHDDLDHNLIDREELNYHSKNKGLHSLLYEYNEVVKVAESDAHLLKATKEYFNAVINKITLWAKSVNYLEFFENNKYKIEEDDFVINGFKLELKEKSSEILMQTKKPEEVIGNMIAKSQSMRLAKMLMAYDFKRQMNPFAELGGFIFTFMGDGNPGTGKTTLIQMMTGLLKDYCEIAKYPLRYENFSTDQIDSYQGKSGQNMKEMINRIIDPSVIAFGTIDDIDQIAGKRGDKQSSSGQQEVTAVLMESFAGANTVVRGNATFGMFSNYPENVDDALRQRAGLRMLIDGPQSLEDYIDIFALLIGNNHSIPVGSHDLYSTQQIKKLLEKSYEQHNVPMEVSVKRAFDRTINDIGDINDMTKVGTYLKNIQNEDPRFTGRAIKNITDSIKTRAMDFEMPDIWFEDPELFLYKDYDTKMGMIKELQKPINMDMVIQSINQYADSEARYSNKSDEEEIKRIMREHKLFEEANRRMSK